MRLLLAGLVIAAVIFGLWYVVVTDRLLIYMMESSLGDDLRVRVTDLKKGLFFDFEAAHMALKKSESVLVSVDDVKGRIHPLRLLLGQPALHLRGSLAGGGIDAMIGPFRRTADVRVTGAHIGEIPFVGFAGVEGTGTLSGQLTIAGGRGDVTFTVTDARLQTGSFGGIAVPLSMFHEARCAMSIQGEVVKVLSFSLEGEGIYARIKGEIAGRTLNLNLELMPDRSFKEAVFLSALGTYRVSPGYYVIPIRKTLTF